MMAVRAALLSHSWCCWCRSLLSHWPRGATLSRLSPPLRSRPSPSQAVVPEFVFPPLTLPSTTRRSPSPPPLPRHGLGCLPAATVAAGAVGPPAVDSRTVLTVSQGGGNAAAGHPPPSASTSTWGWSTPPTRSPPSSPYILFSRWAPRTASAPRREPSTSPAVPTTRLLLPMCLP